MFGFRESRSRGRSRTLLAGFALLSAAWSAPASANEYAASIRRYFEQHVRPWLQEAVVVETVKRQNAETAGLSGDRIGELDREWRQQSEAGGGPLVEEVLTRDLSKFLARKKAESGGYITEIFVMDARGLNVGQSDPTSDYWQGDEAKWQKTFAVGPDAVFVDDIDFDESTGMFQSQISATVTDPQTGEPIGAVTVGLDLEKLTE